jgi:hypothetical protein
LQSDDKFILIADHRQDPETTAIRKSQEQKFLAHLKLKKPVLRELAELILYDQVGSSTPELAVKLNLTILEVESLKKALRRATEEFIEKE